MNTTQFKPQNAEAVAKFVEAWGYAGAKAFIVETLRVQRFTKNETIIRVWEANLLALESLKK